MSNQSARKMGWKMSPGLMKRKLEPLQATISHLMDVGDLVSVAEVGHFLRGICDAMGISFDSLVIHIPGKDGSEEYAGDLAAAALYQRGHYRATQPVSFTIKTETSGRLVPITLRLPEADALSIKKRALAQKTTPAKMLEALVLEVFHGQTEDS